jgi:exodeoxyribonuclease VII large subunit
MNETELFSGIFDGSGKTVHEINTYLDGVGTHKDTSALSQLTQLQTHKSVSVRRKLAALFGKLADNSYITHLSNWKETESDRTTWLALESALDTIQRRKGGVVHITHSLTVTEALTLIKGVVSSNEYIIEGEIHEVSQYGSMYYINLKDTQESILNASAFQGVVYRAGFALNVGLMVRVKGVFKINSKSRLVFDVQHIELTGEGELQRNLMLLTKKLEEEGFMDAARKRTLAKIPQRVLLLASSNSAAVTDFMKVLSERRSGLDVLHLPIKTQGVGVERELLSKLAYVHEICKTRLIDTIVITRGGGSREDLAAFDSEVVVRAIHGLPCPSIVAIGHERDVTLSELVADVRASTPSNAAELVSMANTEILSVLQTSMNTLHHIIYDKHLRYKQFTEQALLKVTMHIKQSISEAFHKSRAFDGVIPSQIYRIRQLSIGSMQKIMYSMSQAISATRLQTETTSQRIALMHPNTILLQGYALISKGNAPLSSIAELRTGDTIDITLQDGQKHAKVLS